METIKNYHRNHFRNKLIFGSLLIVIGAILLGLNFDYIPQVWKPILFSWQMLVILCGVIALFHAAFFKGIILLLLGGFFLAPHFYAACPEHFGWASENFVQTYWPLLLILGGIMLIIYWLLPEKCKKNCRFNGEKHPFGFHLYSSATHKCNCGDNCTCNSDEKKSRSRRKCNCMLDKNVIFAGNDEIFLDEVFNGGEINVVFGGMELDLRRTTLPEGETYLEINTVFGGVTVFVPSTWSVDVRTDAIAGGFMDTRPRDTANIDATRKLVITGSFVFGGGEVR
jgi:hypothetical protein